MYTPDRSKYPEIIDGKPQIDLDSEKYVKIWHGPQHPGITGNMSLELIVSGDEVFDCKTHVGYLHRGFEKLNVQTVEIRKGELGNGEFYQTQRHFCTLSYRHYCARFPGSHQFFKWNPFWRMGYQIHRGEHPGAAQRKSRQS